LLQVTAPFEVDQEKDIKTVADLLVETTSWWVDIFAPSNDEMRAISKVIFFLKKETKDILVSLLNPNK
jgi:Mg2+ and Co2+ transporter CorA